MQTASPLTPGTLLDGRYRLRSLLGEGGMGQVYEGDDLRLGRRVAIKVMHDDSEADETLGERLFREARAAACADHPAVIITYGYGTDAELGISYVIMERLHGVTLAARIAAQSPLSERFVRRIALDLADVLAAVHMAGVVHRDLKPSNVFLASRGLRVDELKLLDFGVAKQLDMQTLTATGQVYGTPTYMAPEQLADSKHVDARCDVYSFGAVMYECLAGEPPFAAKNTATLISEIMFGEVPDLRAARPDVDVALLAVIDRCLRRNARERYADARAVCSALTGLGADPAP